MIQEDGLSRSQLDYTHAGSRKHAPCDMDLSIERIIAPIFDGVVKSCLVRNAPAVHVRTQQNRDHDA